MDIDELEWGAEVPGVVCPKCGGQLINTSVGAFCDWDLVYVPILTSAVYADEEDDEHLEWTDDDDE